MQDVRSSQSEPLPTVLFLRSSHSDDWLPKLFGGVQYLSVETRSPFLLFTSSCFCRRWTCDRRWDKRKHNARTRRAMRRSTMQTCPLGKWWCVLLTTVTRLASAEKHRPRHEADRIGHQNDGLPGRKPAHVAERQLEAIPEEPEEQHVDVLKVIPQRVWR